MKKLIFTTFMMAMITFNVYAAEGLENVESQLSVENTATKITEILNAKGMTVFNQIKHSQSAKEVGIEMQETELIIFGNPKIGSLLMKCQPSIAIDLPQKFLIWQDNENKVWISYNAPKYLQQRHNVEGCDEVFLKIEQALANIANAAANE